jgi:hypothetical protein
MNRLEYFPSVGSALAIEYHWPDGQYKNHRRMTENGTFQIAMDKLQVALISVHIPDMDKPTLARAKRTLKMLELRITQRSKK